MFGKMMKGIAQDFVRYVMHVQVVRPDQQAAPAIPPTPAGSPAPSAAAQSAAAPPARTAPTAPTVSNMRQTSSDDDRTSGFAAAAAAAPAAEKEEIAAAAQQRSATSIAAASPTGRPARRGGTRPAAGQVPKQETVVKDEWSKTPRNAPCPCGSGKKFKLCHGASSH